LVAAAIGRTVCHYLRMDLQVVVYSRQVTRCADCGGKRVVYTGEAGDEERVRAVFWAFLYNHDVREVFIDATLGTWGDESFNADHVTFGSRTGPLGEDGEVVCSLVTGGAMAADDPLLGAKLTREAALGHELLGEFWEVNDAVLSQIPEVERHASGAPARRWLKRRRR
jgi:hypothetical protein